VAYEPRLASLPRVLALSKADLLPADEVAVAVAQWSRRLGEGVPVIATSSATRQGLEELGATLMRMVPALDHAAPSVSDKAPLSAAGSDLAEHMVYRPAERSGFSVQQLDEHLFAVHGRGIERLVQRFDTENEEAMAHLEARLRRIGVIAALESAGFAPGDEIQIAGEVFELDPSPPS
jgi:GTPase